jgi:hypothetical protein
LAPEDRRDRASVRENLSGHGEVGAWGECLL